MKKVIIFSIISTIATCPLFAANPFDKFKDQLSGVTTQIAQKNLDNFAKDLGGLMGGASFHAGKTLGFPGFDVGAHIAARKISEDDAIIKTAGIDNVFLPVIQLEIGLPAKIDLIGRYIAYADATMVGGGLRYGIISNSCPGLPSLSVQALYHTLNVASGVNKLTATNYCAMAMTSFNIPIVDPYLGIGMDSTSVEPDSSVPLPSSGMKGSASSVRIEGGINMTLFPFTYIQIGGTLIAGNLDYNAGLGVKF